MEEKPVLPTSTMLNCAASFKHLAILEDDEVLLEIAEEAEKIALEIAAERSA